MAGDAYGAETQEEPKAQEDIRKRQAAKDQQKVIALAGADWEKQIAERDEKIAALEVQAAEVAKNAKVAEALRGEIAELKAQGESERIDFKLQLAGVRSMRYTFGSCAFTTIDFRGFDPSTLADLFYTFSGCSCLATIYADSTWALPSSGITGSQCFYSCSTSLVGGNGTVWASNKTASTYFRVDTASTPGYITAS